MSPGDIVRVVFPVATDGYDYIVPDGGCAAGDIVLAPVRNEEKIGVVWGPRDEPLDYPVERVRRISGETGYALPKSHLDFLERVARYNMAPLGLALKLALNEDAVGGAEPRFKPASGLGYVPPAFSPEQSAAAAALSARIGAGYSAALLDGVTGSGKTEVYFAVVAKALEAEGAQALVMLPEIALTTQFLDKFEARFGAPPVLWHSACARARRRDAWRGVVSGATRVVVGTRSSLFLPFRNLSLIVLDEEHDGSYKQEDNVIYHGRDMAVLRAAAAKIPIILSSATPSVETVGNVRAGRYSEVRLRERYGGADLPEIRLVDLRSDRPPPREWLSPTLKSKIAEVLLRGEQAMLYINRRGFAPLVLCQSCGHRLKCQNCSVYLTAHSRDGTRCVCHYCGNSVPLPDACPECGQKLSWLLCGPGIERIEDEVRRMWPDARVVSISSDVLTSQTRLSEIIGAIERREADIILGTQIIAKGHHFPSVTLVGVVDGDMGFSSADLRANESAFQVLTQVAGRSGRGDRPGEVYIQTYNPDNAVMRAIVSGDRDGFLAAEIEERRLAGMPPFSRLASLLVQAQDRDVLERYCSALASKAPVGLKDVSCYGPIDAPLQQIKKYHRKRFLLVARGAIRPQGVIRKWLSMAPAPSSVRLKIDIDPYDFM
ncbi:MAG: primosomal protein N' [Rickettsiales bacterium]|nr:primosomal protein N' [Rickettsiales bacterium]